MEPLGIDFTGYIARLCQLRIAIRFCTKAIGSEWENSKDTRESQIKQISKGIDGIFGSLVNSADDDKDKFREQKYKVVAAIREALGIDVSSTILLLNMALVMCCTELEVFIAHVLDVILLTEPRTLKSVASQKTLSAAELVDLRSSERMFQVIRDKVAKEVTDANTKDMFCLHLGRRFGLLSEADLLFQKNVSLQKSNFFGLDRIKEIFDKRHEIVHRGTFPINNLAYFENTISLFIEIERLLTKNAVAKYRCPLRSIHCQLLLDLEDNSQTLDIGALLARAFQAVSPS